MSAPTFCSGRRPCRSSLLRPLCCTSARCPGLVLLPPMESPQPPLAGPARSRQAAAAPRSSSSLPSPRPTTTAPPPCASPRFPATANLCHLLGQPSPWSTPSSPPSSSSATAVVRRPRARHGPPRIPASSLTASRGCNHLRDQDHRTTTSSPARHGTLLSSSPCDPPGLNDASCCLAHWALQVHQWICLSSLPTDVGPTQTHRPAAPTPDLRARARFQLISPRRRLLLRVPSRCWRLLLRVHVPPTPKSRTCRRGIGAPRRPRSSSSALRSCLHSADSPLHRLAIASLAFLHRHPSPRMRRWVSFHVLLGSEKHGQFYMGDGILETGCTPPLNRLRAASTSSSVPISQRPTAVASIQAELQQLRAQQKSLLAEREAERAEQESERQRVQALEAQQDGLLKFVQQLGQQQGWEIPTELLAPPPPYRRESTPHQSGAASNHVEGSPASHVGPSPPGPSPGSHAGASHPSQSP